MPIGYARVPTVHQNLDRQFCALRVAGRKHIFAEKVHGNLVQGRPELDKAPNALGSGDMLILAELDRATRSVFGGISILQRVHARRAGIHVEACMTVFYGGCHGG